MQKYVNKRCRDMEINDAVEGFYLLKSPSAKTTQGGKNFLSFKLADASGEVDAILWDYEGDLHATNAGKPIKVRGTVSEYNGKKQFTGVLSGFDSGPLIKTEEGESLLFSMDEISKAYITDQV